MTISATNPTLLVLNELGVPIYSARGLTQTLLQIDQSVNTERDVNGTLVNLAPVGFQKYKSAITCTDMSVPAIDGVFPGTLVTVQCVAQLAYLTSGGSPKRTVVGGSSYTQGDFTFYRPQLDMMVTAFSISYDEWNVAVQWELDLEEV